MTWLQPYPGVLLDGLAGAAPGPEARYEAREAVSAGFVTALQLLLPPRQRAALSLRDVLGYRARRGRGHPGPRAEESVTSALKRTRAALRYQRARPDGQPPPAGIGAGAGVRAAVHPGVRGG